MGIVIKNGHVLDPESGRDGIYDILVEEDKIVKVQENMNPEGHEVVEANGCYVLPGFIDLHVHLRDPGLEYKETLQTGGRAAVRGGMTTICAMPNTKPVIDTAEKVLDVHKRAMEQSPAAVIQLGAVTKEQEGMQLADIEEMAEAGCRGISEDGKSVMDAALYRRAMTIAKEQGITVFAHCEDRTMVEGGVMNAGVVAERMGLPGITNAVEDVIAARDILLAKETGVKLHLCHCSTKDSVKLLAFAKAEGVAVTGEVCPHHFCLSDEDITSDDGNFKMNPPLRSKEDVEALREGLRTGIMDAIATDHAPHAWEEKNCSIREAAFGIVGMETAAALTYTELVEPGILTMMQMAEKMSMRPAQILGLTDKGAIKEGKTADIVLFDTTREYVIDRNKFVSKGRNTPFHGKKVKGEVVCTIAGGKIVYREGKGID